MYCRAKKWTKTYLRCSSYLGCSWASSRLCNCSFLMHTKNLQIWATLILVHTYGFFTSATRCFWACLNILKLLVWVLQLGMFTWPTPLKYPESKPSPPQTPHEFACRLGEKVRRPAADSILMPATFPIARLNRYTPKFSGVPQKLTWCQQFGLQVLPKWGDANIWPLKKAVFRCFFGQNKFSRLNGRLSPIACHTYLESYGT